MENYKCYQLFTTVSRSVKLFLRFKSFNFHKTFYLFRQIRWFDSSIYNSLSNLTY